MQHLIQQFFFHFSIFFLINLNFYAHEKLVLKRTLAARKKIKKFLKNHSIVYHFLELEKIHFTYFGDFENISYFKSYRCFKKRYPKNIAFFKLENFNEKCSKMIRNSFLTYLEYILGKNFLVFFGLGGSRSYLTLFKRIFKVVNQTNICIKLSFSRAFY
jgi:hypothetical protein